MYLDDSESDEVFRGTVRQWLRENLPEGWLSGRRREPARLGDRFAFRHDWHRRLYGGGWMGIHWPKADGGRGLSMAEQLIFNEELATAKAPQIANWVGVELVGPTLIRWGDFEQKAIYLPRILDGSDIWCQGWSEPDAGSDLTAVGCTAIRQGNTFRIDGHKRWISWAQFASHCMVLTRTGDPQLRHKTLSCFIVPLNSPGVLVRPILMANEEAEENDLLLDSVVVPAANMVGPLNGGWQIVLTAMALARGTATLARTVELEIFFQRLLQMARVPREMDQPALADPRLRQRLIDLWVRIEALKYLVYRKVGEIQRGSEAGPAASAEKLIWSQLSQDLTELALHIEGAKGLLNLPLDSETWPGEWSQKYFRAKATAIEGGTDEIQCNTIARRVLGVMT
jgi:alkylation response protein AidB-like acyl-CoA dehydrogenase